jgi:hypothetical protein
MLIHTLRLSAALACAALLTGCPGVSPAGLGTACTDELRIHLAPRDTAVPVGAAYQASVALSSCGGREKLSDNFVWTAADPAIVRVNASTGRVTALAAGETHVAVEGDYYGRLGNIRVTVRPTAP